jgi:hypothetical protein
MFPYSTENRYNVHVADSTLFWLDAELMIVYIQLRFKASKVHRLHRSAAMIVDLLDS